jgi:hypothetical protein
LYARRLLSQMLHAMDISGTRSYCCTRFRESVEKEQFIHSDSESDETEWFMPEWLHIYYCPFCGTLIKGRGFGDYNRKPFPK